MASILTIPICCLCQQVAERTGMSEVWMEFTRYQDRHHLGEADVQLTHTYCPPCSRGHRRLTISPARTDVVSLIRDAVRLAAGYWALTISRPCANVTLVIPRVAHLAGRPF
jgi:hypothetical protein